MVSYCHAINQTHTHHFAALVKNNPSRLNDMSDCSDAFGQGPRILDDAKLQGLHKHFHPRKQLRKLLRDGIVRWAVTALVILCLYLTLWRYSVREVMSQREKLEFNALITGLSIALGLSIASSLKEIALEARWWILSRRKRSLHEVSHDWFICAPKF